MNSRNAKILDQIRSEALERDIPAADVARWLELARPCARLTGDGDGPVVGRFGGPVLLPADVADPRFPLYATIDCAALPTDVTDLPLPSDGQLLLFGFPESDDNESSMGDVVYVPVGAAVTAGLAALALHLYELTTPETVPASEAERQRVRDCRAEVDRRAVVEHHVAIGSA